MSCAFRIVATPLHTPARNPARNPTGDGLRDYLVFVSRPRGEAVAARFLKMAGAVPYVPRFLKRIDHARTTRYVPEVLFPRYVLVQDMGTLNLYDARGLIGVSDVLRFGGDLGTIPGSVVEEIRSQEQDVDLDGNTQRLVVLSEPKPDETLFFKPGEMVRIAEGAMANMLCHFDRMRGPDRAVVLVSFLGQRGAPMEVPLAHLEKAAVNGPSQEGKRKKAR